MKSVEERIAEQEKKKSEQLTSLLVELDSLIDKNDPESVRWGEEQRLRITNPDKFMQGQIAKDTQLKQDRLNELKSKIVEAESKVSTAKESLAAAKDRLNKIQGDKSVKVVVEDKLDGKSTTLKPLPVLLELSQAQYDHNYANRRFTEATKELGKLTKIAELLQNTLERKKIDTSKHIVFPKK